MGVIFYNVATKQQNTAVKLRMHLPTSISEHWARILIFFPSKSKQILHASNLTNTTPFSQPWNQGRTWNYWCSSAASLAAPQETKAAFTLALFPATFCSFSACFPCANPCSQEHLNKPCWTGVILNVLIKRIKLSKNVQFVIHARTGNFIPLNRQAFIPSQAWNICPHLFPKWQKCWIAAGWPDLQQMWFSQ